MSLPKLKKNKIDKYVGGLSKYKKIFNPIKLSANESALGPSPKAIRAFVNNKNKIFKYPESGSISLRKAISKKFRIKKERIICGSGSDQIFDVICQVLLNKGDEVVVTKFGFIMYKIYASLYGAKVRFAKEENYKASVKSILDSVTKKTKIVFLANPNNPTGTYLTVKEMKHLRKSLRNNILLVVDDAYFEFIKDKNFKSGLDLFKNSENVLITRTFSKIYGLAGLRLGWGYSSKKIIDAMYQVKPPFNVNSAALYAGVEAIKDTEWTKKAIRYNKKWSEKIYKVLEKLNIQTNRTSVNFFLMNFDKKKKNSLVIFEELARNKLLVRKMDQYKIPNSLRVTIGNTKSNLKFINCIKKIVK